MATKMKSDTQLSFDDADRRILAALQRDSTLSVQALAEIAQMSPSPCWRRVKALREAGVGLIGAAGIAHTVKRGGVR